MAEVTQLPGYGPPTPVPIFQWEQEFSELLKIYRQRKPRKVLEIGTFHGGTLYHWLKNSFCGTTVVSVDSYKTGIDNRNLYNGWCPGGVNVLAIEGDSRDNKTYDQVYDFAPFDWIWIDGGHEYHEVKSDWDMYSPLASKNAIICFHDILPPTKAWPKIEVNQLWEELKLRYWTQEIIHDKNADWGGIGVLLNV